ncbi:YggS family pyridoxal phosphate-dependent enzyme [Bacillus sp. NPDC093026]|uniref:YggS family pyridoxal phosphate-dependent enzyme n=1 Tax=Bacillus sp. NPDC093026 TaxID=3363948 RepID=UPI0038103030
MQLKVREKFRQINEQINEACKRAGRNPENVSVVAVTKYVSIERAIEAKEAGIVHFGENRDRGLLEKQAAITDESINWHFIGSLQTRKVKSVIHTIDYLHSLDRISLANEIEKRADHTVRCFVQVNTSLEESKHGLKSEEVIPFVRQLADFKHIEIVGLMTMAPFTDDHAVIRNCFKTLRSLQEEVKHLNQENAPCQHLSMGMSNDFEIAIEEGATFVRIGSSLVGNETGGA